MIGSWNLYSSLIEFSERYGTKELLSDGGDKRRVPFEGNRLRPREGTERELRTNPSCQSEDQAQHEVHA
jgi:hypothetical protein